VPAGQSVPETLRAKSAFSFHAEGAYPGNRGSRVNGSLHGEEGRAYLWELRPELAQRLAPAREYRFGEIIFIKPVASVIGPKKLRGLRA